MFLALLTALFFCKPSQAFLTLAETGEIIPMDTYRVGVGGQIRLSDGNGANAVGNFDAAINEESSYRLNMGFGETDFFIGGSYKWIPIPDYNKQPAMGLRFGGLYARPKSVNYFALRVDPLISKKFSTDYGILTPYGAIPVMLAFVDSKNELQAQITAGAEFKPNDNDKWIFGSEVGVNAKDSFSYFLITVSYLLDEVKGRK